MDMFRKFGGYAVARMAEPSTYAGLAAMAAVLGYSVDPGVLQVVAQVGTGVAASAAMVMREKHPAV